MPSHPTLLGEALQQAIVDAARCISARRHMLEPIPIPPDAPRPTFGALMASRCVQCGTLRYDKVSRLTGQRLAAPEYDHPAAYRAALDERHDGNWWRATYWETLGPEFFLEPEVVVPLKRRGRNP